MKKLDLVKSFFAALVAASGAWAQTIWNGTTDTTWYTDDKTKTEYTINTAEQLAGLAVLVNGNLFVSNETYNMEGKTIILGSNIMLNDTNSSGGWQNWKTAAPARTWTAIGTKTNYFGGTFDGNGKIVSGIFINNSESDYQGLFGCIDNGTVKNLGITASFVNGKKSVGLLSGYAWVYSNNEITNCYSKGIVSGLNYVGGFIGDNYSNVKDCYSSATVIGILTSSTDVGGFVGYNSGYIYNCYSTGNVSSDGFSVGGFLGNNNGYVYNSYSAGNISGKSNVGGFTGYNNSGYIFNCYSTGDAYGKVYGTASRTDNGVGGFIGYNSGDIFNSYSTGNAYANGYGVGGFIGEDEYGFTANCYSLGNATGITYVSGFVGSQRSKISKFYNCYSAGIVSSTTGDISSGGFTSGADTHSDIKNCYYDKTTSGKSDEFAGKWAGMTTAEMKSSTFANTLTQNAAAMNSDAGKYVYYDWQYKNGYPELFIPVVTDITGVATSMNYNQYVRLDAKVIPENTPNKQIVWSVVSGAGEISNDYLRATGAGTIQLKATISKGLLTSDYAKTFFITVNKITQNPPNTSYFTAMITDKTITLPTGGNIEYSKDNGNTWTNGGYFSGLTPNTQYKFLVRYKETDNQYASESVEWILKTFVSQENPIRNIRKSDDIYGIKFTNNVVSDKAEIFVNSEFAIRSSELKIYDMLGNVVFESNAKNGEFVWDLRNKSGRIVANGTYLAVVEAKDKNGKVHWYSAKFGVKR
jgi:hypothetical protein